MLFCNISSDRVHLGDFTKQQFLDRDSIEETLGPALVEWYRGEKFEKILVINGPGGFTNLRVGTLIVNLLNTLEDHQIGLLSLTKIELYKYLVKQNFLPSKGYIYIGQKKNVRLYDFDTDSYETIKKDAIDFDADDIFFDRTSADYWGKDVPMLGFDMQWSGLLVTYQDEDLDIPFDALGLQPNKTIEPHYFVDPVIGEKKK